MLQTVEERDLNDLCYLPEIIVEGLFVTFDEVCL